MYSSSRLVTLCLLGKGLVLGEELKPGPNTATIIHPRCPEYHVPCTSPPPVGARARPSAHRPCLSGLNGAPGRQCSLRNVLEPKTVDPHPVNATHPAQAAPRSVAACRRTAAGSDTPRPAGASNTVRVLRAVLRFSPAAAGGSSKTISRFSVALRGRITAT